MSKEDKRIAFVVSPKSIEFTFGLVILSFLFEQEFIIKAKNIITIYL